METPEVISVRVVDHIQTLPTKTLSGTDLAQYLKFAIRGFSPFLYGCPNLRAFVQRFIPALTSVGRAGGDFLYGLASQNPDLSNTSTPPTETIPRSTTALNAKREVWKAYSSPNSLWRVFGNQETGELEVVPPGRGALTAPWVLIPPCSPEAHLQIANDFISGLTDERQSVAFRQVLSQPRWWDAFLSVAIQLNILREWQAHRRRGIASRFSAAMSRLGIPFKPQTVPTTIVSVPPVAVSTSKQFSASSPKIEKTTELERLRRSVIFAVERMSISELRALLIPVGYLFDEHKRDE